MGLYDYLGDFQVKCFAQAGVGIKPNGDNFELILNAFGGELKYYNRGSLVPYKTPFYNFGKDFMIFDYRTFNYDEPINHDELMVHIIRNGHYFRSVRYDKVPTRYKIGLVIDNYGEVVNIKTHNDFKEIVYNWRYSHKKYDELCESYRKEMGIPDILRISVDKIKELNLSQEEFKEILDKNSECMDRASAESLNCFSETWYKGTKEIEDEINKGWPFGALYYALEKQNILEFDKYWIARLFVKKLEKKGKTLMMSLGEYFDWCLDNDINIDKLKFIMFFSKYLQDIPEDIIKEYENSDEKKYRDKVYGYKG